MEFEKWNVSIKFKYKLEGFIERFVWINCFTDIFFLKKSECGKWQKCLLRIEVYNVGPDYYLVLREIIPQDTSL